VLSPANHIPAYRLPMGVSVPPLGPLAGHWRGPLTTTLGPLTREQLVVDCRSGAYVAAMRPHGDAWYQVRVEREAKGRRSVVSHFAKHARGLLAGLLATATSAPTSGEELAHAATALVGQPTGAATLTGVELHPGCLTLVVT